jgi:hypothetical protein
VVNVWESLSLRIGYAKAVLVGVPGMGCAARRGEPTFFNDYHSAASHYARSSLCNKSMRGIKTVTVQLNTRPQHVGDGEAGGGGAPGPWRPQPAPSRRAGAMI